MQGLDLLGSQPGHLQHRYQSGRRGGLELLVIRQPARRHQLPNLLLQRLPDPLDLPQPPFAHNLAQRLVQRLDRARPVQVGPDLERILPFQLEQRRDAHQNLGNLILVHRPIMKPKAQNARRRPRGHKEAKGATITCANTTGACADLMPMFRMPGASAAVHILLAMRLRPLRGPCVGASLLFDERWQAFSCGRRNSGGRAWLISSWHTPPAPPWPREP